MLSLVPDLPTHMWHVTLTVEGPPVEAAEIKGALERLSHEHPFLLDGRYSEGRAEVRYWDEAVDAAAALDLAAKLWSEHRISAGLPDWAVVGVEVLARQTFHRRVRAAHGQPGLVAAGRIVPF